MLAPFRTLSTALLAVLIQSPPAGAQTNALHLDGSSAQGLTGVIVNGRVSLCWPVQPGTWELMEQQPAFKGDWKPVPPENYQTNAYGISVTLPLPAKPALYRLKRVLGFRPARGPATAPPPLPPLLTNPPRPFKAPDHP